VVQDAIKANFQPRSGESNQGAQGRVNEIGANFMDYLYNPGDLANATIQVVGDPSWLQQGEIVGAISPNTFNPGPFLADGTINFESRQILFEILINTPGDYDMDTGLIDPNKRQTVFNPTTRAGAAKQSYVYQANSCVSEFVKGKFVQTLKGTLLTFLPDQTFKDAQSNGRPATRGLGDATRDSDNPTLENGDADAQEGGFYGEGQDLETDRTYEEDPISDPEPQPAPEPREPDSDGDIDYTPNLAQNEGEEAGIDFESQLMDREA
jgi:hypothetical protein